MNRSAPARLHPGTKSIVSLIVSSAEGQEDEFAEKKHKWMS